jgi:hypothetical protein
MMPVNARVMDCAVNQEIGHVLDRKLLVMPRPMVCSRLREATKTEM